MFCCTNQRMSFIQKWFIWIQFGWIKEIFLLIQPNFGQFDQILIDLTKDLGSSYKMVWLDEVNFILGVAYKLTGAISKEC